MGADRRSDVLAWSRVLGHPPARPARPGQEVRGRVGGTAGLHRSLRHGRYLLVRSTRRVPDPVPVRRRRPQAPAYVVRPSGIDRRRGPIYLGPADTIGNVPAHFRFIRRRRPLPRPPADPHSAVGVGDGGVYRPAYLRLPLGQGSLLQGLPRPPLPGSRPE